MHRTSARSSGSDTAYAGGPSTTYAGGPDTGHRLFGRSDAGICAGAIYGGERSSVTSPGKDHGSGTGDVLDAAVPCCNSSAEACRVIFANAAAAAEEEQDQHCCCRS